MAIVKKEVSQDRDAEVWRLRLKGWHQSKIAAELNISQPTVCESLKRTRLRLADEFTEEQREIKAEQADQLREVYAEAMAAWAKSKEGAERETVVSGRVKVSDILGMIELPDQITHVVEGQSGNPAFLLAAMKALEEIRAIYGMDAPKKTDVTSGGEVIKVYGPGVDLAEI